MATVIDTTSSKEKTRAKKQNWAGMGKKDAESILELAAKAEGYARKLLTERAAQLGDKDARAKWLEGFKSVMGKVRASESKAVIEAFWTDSKQVQDLSVDATVGYHDFVVKAREIRNSNPDFSRASTAGTKRASKVTDKQFAEIITRISVMTPVQLSNVVKSCMGQHKAHKGWEPVVLALVNEFGNVLKTSDDKKFINAGAAIIDIVDEYTTSGAAAFAEAKRQQAEKDMGTAERVNPEGEVETDGMQYPVPATGNNEQHQTGTHG